VSKKPAALTFQKQLLIAWSATSRTPFLSEAMTGVPQLIEPFVGLELPAVHWVAWRSHWSV
jgi:hypothetical protein